ncbi:MAG TPA: T9SS type A sorting domain-containing protein [Mucilaginibacter sp.]|nr:T9SS type A sorting domain-containing protein [Mucilaginibacter sp.]
MKKITLLFFIIGYSKVFAQTDSLRISPNPFNAATTIYYYVATTDTTTLEVFNNLGNTIKTFYLDSIVNAGAYSINYNTLSLPNGTYYFHLKVGTNSTNKVGVKNSSAGINQSESNSEEIALYPNPVKDILQIDYFGKKQILITDINGKIIKSIITTDKSISLSDLNTGSYFMQIFSENNKLFGTQKFIKVAQ